MQIVKALISIVCFLFAMVGVYFGIESIRSEYIDFAICHFILALCNIFVCFYMMSII